MSISPPAWREGKRDEREERKEKGHREEKE
jgi:hypothetical protein